jgi:DNA-binding NtrC family response regulator
VSASILICDDEKNIRRTLGMVLEGLGHRVSEAATAEDALKAIETEEFDLLILDVRLPKMTGLEALQVIRGKPDQRALPVVMISGHASLAEAVHCVQLGATDFLEKPLDRDRVLVSVANALKSSRLEREMHRLRAEVEERYQMIGKSAVMQELYTQIEKVAPTKGRVLITGESGTGKELVARAIQRKKGMFELADGGTLFLDEIGDMSSGAQAKVLRSLQSGEISRVGSERSISIDVRVLAATNKNLAAEVENGNFRDDLYFRLNVVPIRSPALRERIEDIPLLATAFLEDFCREYIGKQKEADPEVFRLLQERPWPGNVRELRNVIERMVILSGAEITAEDVPMHGLLRESPELKPAGTPCDPSDPSAPSLGVPLHAGEVLSLRDFRDRAETEYIRATLKACEWNISKAAAQLGVERTNLHKKMRALGIHRAQ